MLNFSLIMGYADNINFIEKDTYDEVEIINPDKDIIYSDYLLISIKIKENTSCNLSILTNLDKKKIQEIEVSSISSSGAVAVTSNEREEAQEEKCILYGPEKIDKAKEVNFYTVQLEHLIPGQYEIQIEVLDDKDKIEHTITKTFEIQEKSMMPEETVDENMFNKEKPTGLDVIKDIIDNLFGD